jgi:hypothetical protein
MHNVPTEALYVTPCLESFCWRVEQLAGDGGSPSSSAR